MQQHLFYLIVSLMILIKSTQSFGQVNKTKDYLLLFSSSNNEYGYKNQKGEIIIPPGKYSICYTDTFRSYAIVLKAKDGFLAIDRKENMLYQIFPFENGPDFPSGGFFRILKDKKIGFANASTGRITIQPQFECAFPFENGVAKVSNSCTKKSDGEHSTWQSDTWYYIDKNGKEVKPKTNP